MQSVGFSTGALSLGDFRRALRLMHGTPLRAVELSALRLPELSILIGAHKDLDLQQYNYISFHAPSHFSAPEEDGVIDLLHRLPTAWPIILHPDSIHDKSKWGTFGTQLVIENMDRRKSTGRSASELGPWFDALPNARFCFDLAHAHQCDRTMTEAYRILRDFGARICQLHISEIDSAGRHFPLSYSSMLAFSDVAAFLPAECPVIIESLNPFPEVGEEKQRAWMQREAENARKAIKPRTENSEDSEEEAPASLYYTPLTA